MCAKRKHKDVINSPVKGIGLKQREFICMYVKDCGHNIGYLQSLTTDWATWWILKLDVHESVHRDIIMNTTNKIQIQVYRLIF
jgi:hypothetical protein